MKKYYRKGAAVVLGFGVLALVFLACSARKPQGPEHFGTGINFPKFQGPGDFFRRLAGVNEIMFRHKLNGQPVDMNWIDPPFREKLCLTLTINNHCVG